MVDINLKLEHADEKKGPNPITAGIILGAILLLLIIGYGGLLFYESGLQKKIEAGNTEYSVKLEEFKAGKAKSVFDFQNRLNNVIELTSKTEKTEEILSNIEKTIIPDIYIGSLEYLRDEGKIKLILNAKNYNGMARQLLSFKNSGYFSDIQVQGSKVNDGSVTFPVTLSIK